MKPLVVAILDSMWDWRAQTSGAGYSEAPPYFRINPENHSGKRLYKIVGDEADLLVTNSCRELVSGPREHGKPDPAWLAANLLMLHQKFGIAVLLVCGRVAKETWTRCGVQIGGTLLVVEMMHPAARTWTHGMIRDHRLAISKHLRANP